jgi:hypothetical protein
MQGAHGTIPFVEKQNGQRGISMKRSQTSAMRATARWVRGATLSAALAALGALGACSSAPPLFAPNGQPTVLVQCPAGSDNCDQQAQAACGGAFDTLRVTTENNTRSLLYACRAK